MTGFIIIDRLSTATYNLVKQIIYCNI